MSTPESFETNSEDDYVGETDDDDDNGSPGPSSRLSGLNRPKIGSGSMRYKRQKTSGKSHKAKGTNKGRNFGKLAQLMSMPLDVFFEITSRLEPLDILQLSRVSKHFRTTFASQSSRHNWVAARRNISSMPDCPNDLSEPQYASLMFEHNCQACGKSRAQKTDYSLRVRFCGPCFKENVKKGSTIMRPFRNVPENVLTLVPRSFLKSSDLFHYSGLPGTFEAKTNHKGNHFYVPEVEMVIERWRELQYDTKALDLFKNRQMAIASEIMSHAKDLDEWVLTHKHEKYVEDTERAENRESSIKEKLIELGYDASDFPSTYEHRWYSIMNQPRELTPRIWKAIRPKLEALIAEEKENRAKRARDHRLVTRKAEVRPFWASFIADIRTSQAREVMPTFFGACELPTIAAMLLDNDAHTIITEERFLAQKEAILADIIEYQIKIKRELVKCFPSQGTASTDKQNTTAGIENEEMDLSILDRATTLFRCSDSWYCKTLLPYPDIFEHHHVKDSTPFSPAALLRLQPGANVESTAVLLLNALGLPEDTSVTALDDVRLICNCGHPDFRKPMDFGTLIHHFMDEDEWYKMMVAQRTETRPDLVLHNDHDLSASNSCVALLRPDDLLSHGQCNEKEDETTSGGSSESFVAKYCVKCWQLCLRHVVLKSQADLTYHMKGKHLKEACEDDAVLYSELRSF
ncbi:hypothetical protein PILCRDRAFT_823618 [Piloderma croceum F 1598]|uniref:F-box domain-containing protein n=1 Tax=Piloderma croceum (strain F 1598) TaxID=765440 RepID=A0A0C3AZC9_PILCF|nr:hypothetical protein PILCRDRAFT_823618 [Piloderma croceum F 1598]